MVGIWPYQSQLKKKIIQSISIFIMFTFFPPQVKETVSYQKLCAKYLHTYLLRKVKFRAS